MTLKPRPPACDMRDASLTDMLDAFADVERDADAACWFLTRPRTYLSERGILVPSDTEISAVPTEELRLRLMTPAGLEDYILTDQSDALFIRIHIKDGIAKCTRIKFKCPKKKPKPKPATAVTRNIAEAFSLRDLAKIADEVETGKAAAEELMASPRRFFEARGLLAPPNVRFRLIDTNGLRDMLGDELAVDGMLDRQAAGSFEVHIKKGIAKCTKVTVECDK